MIDAGDPIDPSDPNDPSDPSDPSAEPDADDLPFVELARDDRPPSGVVRTWWFVAAAAVLVVVAMTVGIAVFNSAATHVDIGTRTADGAARAYLRAVNSGRGDAAAALSCKAFRDDARAAARSGAQGFRFALAAMRTGAGGTATATVRVSLKLAGQTQSETVRIAIFRDAGQWHVCGQQS